MTQRLMVRVGMLLLAAVLVLPGRAAFATEQGAIVTATGTTTAMLGEHQIAAVRQGERVTVSGTGFRANELVGLWITLPTGAVWGLDNDNIRADHAGAFVAPVTLDGSYPTGLHHISARGKVSGRGDITPVNLLASGAEAAAETALSVAPTAARQLERVELVGSGFTSYEQVSMWLTLPDGAVLGQGVWQAGADGRLGRSVYLSGELPVGEYALSARGNTSGRIAIAYFTLLAGAGVDGSSEVVAHVGSFQQRSTIEISGHSFRSNESVSFWLTKPDSSVVGLRERRADSRGVLQTTAYLSEALPVGTYYLSYRANYSGTVQVVTLQLEHGPQNPGLE